MKSGEMTKLGHAKKIMMIEPDRRKLGKRLRKAREVRGLSQEDVASACKVTRAAVSLWETGDALAQIKKLDRAAAVLHVDLDWLLTGVGKEPVGGNGKAVDGRARRNFRLVDSPDFEDWSMRPSEPPFIGGVAEIELGVGGDGTYAPNKKVMNWWRLPPAVIAGQMHADPKNLRVFQVHSDTMEPKILNRSHVFIDIGQTTPIHGSVFALDNGISILLKTLIVDPTRKDIIGLRDGTNGHGDAQFIARKKLKIVGRCVGHLAYL